MTTSPSTTTGVQPQPLPDPVEVLPPYSGPDTECVKCSNGEAFTRYRPAIGRHLADRNGVTALRNRLPERLERQCQRCDFEWDEALEPAPGVRRATVADVAHALLHSHTGWALDLSSGCAEHMAAVLLEMLHVHVRPEHPGWKPVPARLLVPPAAAPDPADTAQVAAVPIVVQAEQDRPQPRAEQRPAAVSPVLLQEKPVPAGPTAYAPGSES